MIPYLVEVEDIPQSTLASPRTPFINVGSPEFSQFQYFEHHFNTFQSYSIANRSSHKEIAPLSSSTTSTSRVTIGPSQQSMTIAPVSLPTCPIPMGTIGINKTKIAITSMTTGSSNLFSQSYTRPFTYGMPTWIPTPPANEVSQTFIPSIPAVSRIPFNPFYPTSFGMSHIPPFSPFLSSGYITYTSHPIHNVPTQLGYGSFGIPLPHGGG